MSPAATLLIRCDAGVAIGTGHVMRCLALAQAWQDAGGRAIFAMAAATPAIEKRLRSEGCEVVHLDVLVASASDATEAARLAQRHTAAWVVLDGYEFGAEYQARLKSGDLKLLLVDDNGHAGQYSADLVLNQNAYASETFYPNRDACTRLLLGPRYAMLRREYAPWRGWKRQIPPIARNVLVTMGGSDPDNVTRTAVDGLRRLEGEGLRIRVLVGGSNPHLAAVEELRSDARNSIELVRDAADMPQQLSWADLAVAAAGSTCLEMCLMGLPALLIDLAENQTPIASEFERRGTAYHLGNPKTVTPNQIEGKTRHLVASEAERNAMSRRGRELVDGEGAERVVRELLLS